ncbi:MAG: glucose-6-phosphate isomerase [Verrucomicrobiota bacterium]
MNLSKLQLWERFQQYYKEFPSIHLALDLSRMNFRDTFLAEMEPRMQKAFESMAELEKGAIANPDEKRMVGHYWLRNPSLAPTTEIRHEIENTLKAIKQFAAQIHSGEIAGSGGAFKNLLLIGIGGSALGPQFVSHALSHPKTDKIRLFTFDNTDPDGMDRVLETIGNHDFSRTLCVVISKSGGTKETRNGMLEAKAAFETEKLNFGSHCVAVTQSGSELDSYAITNKWLKRFPMWDWVGGRTSELSAVGLLPAALQGFDIDSMLEGAKLCDQLTRVAKTLDNPSALMALMWHHAVNGIGSKSMVVLPYKDRLELFSKYLQQLIMESLGKEKDLDGKVVHQGLSVFGNKGSTDQHAYVQQLRDGVDNFFITFIEVLKDRTGTSISVEGDAISGDYLMGFFLGTRTALTESGRESISLTISEVNAFSVGVLIALFERSVGLYASLININAYHQPGVEAGKKAATEVLVLEGKIRKCLVSGSKLSAKEISIQVGAPDSIELVFKICEHLVANEKGIKREAYNSLFDAIYFAC